jgi:hypothetical protein
MWEKLLLDFFKVGQNAAGLSSCWTNELHSHVENLYYRIPLLLSDGFWKKNTVDIWFLLK